MADFRAQLQAFEDILKSATSGLKQKFDQVTFKMLVDCLKSEDLEAVRISISQLEKEKNPLAIPPLYLVAEAHPSSFIRERAAQALKILDPNQTANKIANGKDYKEAVPELVKRFGNYKGK